MKERQAGSFLHLAIQMPSSSPLLLDLKAVFTRRNMLRAWKATVRHGLRRQAMQDLHDYLDVHRNIASYVWRLRADVLKGRYRPGEPAIVRLEKKHGITRRLMLPPPADAIVLQTIVNQLEPRLLRRSPTESAYYARSHPAPSVDRVDSTFPYAWWELWPAFQERIWGFSVAQPLVVVTDVANYFDTIPLASLRDTVAAAGRFDQAVLDLLFFVLEAFVWRPDYIPLSGVGLPQIDFDAPRLLAHAYLFPIDKLVDHSTSGHYVRWMDDMNFGVNSRTEARDLLGRIDARMNMLGVRLNPGKTRILDSAAAQWHFLIQENRELNILHNSLRHGSRAPHLRSLIQRIVHDRYSNFMRLDRGGAWPKVLKRYLTILGELQDDLLQPEVPEILREHPGARDSVFRYYRHLGHSRVRQHHITDYLRQECTDDTSMFAACQLLVAWSIPTHGRSRGDFLQLAQELGSGRRQQISAFAGGLWLLAKYGSRTALWRYIDRTKGTWQRSAWAARQVAAVSARLTLSQRRQLQDRFAGGGLLEALQVQAHLNHLDSLRSADRQLFTYLTHPPSPPYEYPLSKVLLLTALKNGALSGREKARLFSAARLLITDPICLDLVA